MKNFKTPEKYLSWISQELEAANYHDFIDLPEKLYDRILNCPEICVDFPKDELAVAKIIAEEFYKSI